ncbi:MAG: hypothetical protein SPE10_00325 [Paludibacteraceae bacterium]|nr:hypothetical protein [Paludibacteraceae bacterium]
MISTKRLFIALLGLLLCCGIECVAEDIFSTPLMTTVQRDYPSARAVRSGTSVRAATTTAPAATGTSYSVLPSTNTLFNKQSASSTCAVGGGFGGGASTAFGGRRTASASVDAGGFSDGLFGETTVRPFAVPQTRAVPGTIPGAAIGVLCPLTDAVWFLLGLAVLYMAFRRVRLWRKAH